MPESTSIRVEGARRRRSPAESRQEILDEVVDLLWDRPIRDLSIVMIMRGTGLSRPAFYQYFRNIPDLIEELLVDLEVEMNEAAVAWFMAEGAAKDEIRESLGGIVDVCRSHGPVFRAISESAPHDARLEAAWSKFMGGWDHSVKERILKGQAEGFYRDGDAAMIARALNRMDAEILIDGFGRRKQRDPEVVLETLYTVWSRTLLHAAYLD
jgi:AcrR family transcriptional regulator